MPNNKTYKPQLSNYISNLRVVSMIPGDRKVAGCLMFSGNDGGFL